MPVRTVPARIDSIDALRGFIMFVMIAVNDLAGADSAIVPPALRHFKVDATHNGMTFVDLVFPGFLFLAGMSIPLALGSRLKSGVRPLALLGHVLIRTVSLLAIGILMVNDESHDAKQLGWSTALWSVLMYTSSLLAYSSFPRPQSPDLPAATGSSRLGWAVLVRIMGLLSLLVLAVCFRGAGGQRIVSFHPFSVHTEWYGILGLIGWAYLMGSIIYLLFPQSPMAWLGWVGLLLCFFVADRTGRFDGLWLHRQVNIGIALGSQASITVAGAVLASVLIDPNKTPRSIVSFTLLFSLGFGLAAWLLTGLYGISKNAATPSWCLWACSITAALWLPFHWLFDRNSKAAISRPLIHAGRNALLAYLLSEMLPSLLELLGWAETYGRWAGPTLTNAIIRSCGCAVLILTLANLISRAGLRLKL